MRREIFFLTFADLKPVFTSVDVDRFIFEKKVCLINIF